MSYNKRDHSSRAAARDRRFGETDITGRNSYMSNAPMSLVSLPLNVRGTPSKAVPVQGTADINADGTVDLKLRTHISNLSGAERAASAAADRLEPIVPHYLDITQRYANRSITPAAGTVSSTSIFGKINYRLRSPSFKPVILFVHNGNFIDPNRAFPNPGQTCRES